MMQAEIERERAIAIALALGVITLQEATEAGFEETSCIRCGCTDTRACPGGCGWLRLDREVHLGICTACDATPGLTLEDVREASRRGLAKGVPR